MYKIAGVEPEEREILFQNTAFRKGMNAAIIEKDFWVCLTLDYLFHRCRWKDAFAFKGGTSLSKAYGLIDRFSEDIDLILDWRVIGYTVDEPWESRSNTRQLKFNEESEHRVFNFLRDVFLPVFRDEMSEAINAGVNVYIDQDDPGTVKFRYPRSFEDPSILQEIRLEIGTLAAWTPTQYAEIQSYAAECYPQVFTQPSTIILTTTAERTFWEKATILHQEAYRPEGSKLPNRYSRHYYDLYCMAHKGILEKAMQQPDLLVRVSEFKQKFYPRKWAKYEEARMGSLRLVPAVHSLPRLKEDYEKMKEMIYGDYPAFDELMQYIARLENSINNA